VRLVDRPPAPAGSTPLCCFQLNQSDSVKEVTMDNLMKREVGLWIDHCKAVIVTIAHHGGGVKNIQSMVEKHVRFSGVGSQDGWVGNMQDRKFANHLTGYYDDIIERILDAESIQIYGPGDAKLQLEKRLKHAELGERIVRIETVDKMTDRQIEAKVWQHYLSGMGRADVQNRST
jgi:hypothetical protein